MKCDTCGKEYTEDHCPDCGVQEYVSETPPLEFHDTYPPITTLSPERKQDAASRKTSLKTRLAGSAKVQKGARFLYHYRRIITVAFSLLVILLLIWMIAGFIFGAMRVPFGKSLSTGKGSVQVESTKKASSISADTSHTMIYTPKEGHRFLLVEISLAADLTLKKGETTQDALQDTKIKMHSKAENFYLKTPRGTYQALPLTAAPRERIFTKMELSRGQNIFSYLVFEVPISVDVEDCYLQYRRAFSFNRNFLLTS